MKWLLMVQGVFLFLTSALTQGSAQFRCFTTPSSAGELNCGTADGEFEAASVEECCLSPNGQFFVARAGTEGCTACIVFGWFDGTDITLSERRETYGLQAGFIKGGAVQNFVTAQGLASFNIAVEERGAVEGVNADFIVQDTSHLLFESNPSPFNVPVTVRLDGIALETAEGFTLSLDPINPTATNILAGGIPGLFVIPEISVVIQDLENASLQFTEARYSRVESKKFIQPQLQLSTTIATDLIVQVIPLNLTYARDNMLLPEFLDPIETDPNFNPNTQTATSVADFSITPVQVTFASERSPETIEFEMNIADDTIHEADQVFVLRLGGEDRSRIFPGRPDGLTSLGRIIDDDSIVIGFEQNTYTVFEAFNTTGELIQIPVIKGNNRQSELDFDVIAQFIDGTATREIDNTIADYIKPDPRISLPFPAAAERIHFDFELINDRLPEDVEDFGIELTTSGAPRVVVGQAGGSARIVIIDEDVLTIGWERNLTIVSETEGFVELCLRILDVDPSEVLAGFSVMLFIGTIRGTAADHGDYTELRTDSNFVFISDENRLACVDVNINDDDLLEEVEFFSVQVVPGLDSLSEKIRLDPDLTFVEILDNDSMGTIGFDLDLYTTNEDGSSVTLTVRVISGTLTTDVPIIFSTRNDQALDGEDYMLTTQLLTFTSTESEQFVTIPIIDDTFFEFQEQFFGELTQLPDAVNVVLSPDEATVLINDNDALRIGFNPVMYTVREDEGLVTLTVEVLQGQPGPGTMVPVSYRLLDDTALVASDYVSTSRQLVFTNADLSRDFTVGIINDVIAELDEVFLGQLFDGSVDLKFSLDPQNATVTILDNDASPSTALFQLTLLQTGECVEWVFDNPAKKSQDILSDVADVVEMRCSCGFTAAHITDNKFSCRSIENTVVFRAEIMYSGNFNAGELVGFISDWVQGGASIVADGTRLAVDNSCPTQLDSFLSDDCVSTDQGETLSTGAIVGGIVGGVCVLLISTSIITVVILVRRRKLKKFSHTAEVIELSQGPIPVNANAYGISVTKSALPTSLASTPAYGELSSPTEESASAYEMVPHPDENEGEHKYDVIPYHLPSSNK